MTSRPFGRMVRRMRFSSSARCPLTGAAMPTASRPARKSRPRGAVDLEVLFLTLVMSPLDSGKLKTLAAELDTKRVRFDEPLAPYTTFKIGGPADVVFETQKADDLS